MESQAQDKRGIRLLKKGKMGLVRVIFSRLGLITLLFLVQVVFLAALFFRFEKFLPHIWGGSLLFTMAVLVYLVNSRIDPTAKITWLIILMAVPVFGALLLLYMRTDIGHRALKTRLSYLLFETEDIISESNHALVSLEEESSETASLAHYIQRTGCFPVYQNTRVTYFPSGEATFEALLSELEKAESFIFLEYFIIAEGDMWGQILEVLARKAAEGVEVRVMYDGTCEFSTLPHDYPKRLQQLGIQCKLFSPISPFVSTHYNYRDHRKILVIDGQTAFTGGVNLADEYINRIEKHGHWKDAAIRLEGEAAQSFVLMFLQLWSVTDRTPEFTRYLAAHPRPLSDAPGYVIPYADCPLDNDKVGERVYMNLLNCAQRYVHIMSPYLILDNELEVAIEFAAQRGVDVSLILPGIPDKKAPYALAWTHYAPLLDAGVHIYEYTPGFIHSKVFVSDDEKAVVGTINLDYRSFCHHFECAAYLYKTTCIDAIERDFQETLPLCRQVTYETIRGEKRMRKIIGHIMKFIAPLL